MPALPPEGHGRVPERSADPTGLPGKPVLDALAKALSPEEIEEGLAQALACSTGSQNDAAARGTASSRS
jgi:hypothetical protein